MIAPPPPDAAEIVVTALPAARGAAAYDTVTLDSDALTMTPSGRIEDILGTVAGFQQFRRTDSRSANPTSQGATLRALGGNASSRALVLLDGAPVADPFAGYIPWFALAPERLASVRVTRGAGAGAFGEGALAGTIELASPVPGGGVTAALDGGSRGGFSGSGEVSAALGQGGIALSGREDRGDGYILTPASQRGPADIPAAYQQASVALRAVVPAGTTTLSLDALAYDDHRTRGVAGVTSHDTGFLGSLRAAGGTAWRFDALAFLNAPTFATTAVSLDPSRTVATPSSNQFNTPAIGVGGKLELRPPTPHGLELRLGVDLKDDSGRSEEFARYVGSGFTQLRVTGGTNLVTGGFAEATVEVDPRLTLTATGRVDYWRIADGYLDQRDLVAGTANVHATYPARDRVEPNGRAGVRWTVAPGVMLRGAGYTGYRLPTLNELYRPFRVGLDATAANSALVPERLRGVEAGVDLVRPGVRASLTGFVNHVANAIGNMTAGVGPGTFDQVGFVAAGGVFRRRVNLNAIDATGIEAEFHASRGPWRFDLSYAYTDARVAAPGTPLDGRVPADTPQQAAAATLGWEANGFRLAAIAHYAGPQFDDDLASRRLGSATTVDAEAEVPIARRVRLVLRAENLANAQVASGVSATGVIDLGTPRTLWAGVRLGPF